VSGYATGVAAAAPGGLQLNVYPNPFNPSVQLSFVNPARSAVKATIHDAQGRLVRTLVSHTVAAGELKMTWDGRDDRSVRVASGVYFLRVRAGAESATRKLVLLR
jgi:flagellar hook assembly protein FlgD